MIVLTVLAGVCTFFVTCFGVGMLTGAIIGPLGFVAGFAFGAYASVWVVRKCSSGMDAGIRQASDTGGNLGSDKQATNDGESGMKQ